MSTMFDFKDNAKVGAKVSRYLCDRIDHAQGWAKHEAYNYIHTDQINHLLKAKFEEGRLAMAKEILEAFRKPTGVPDPME